MAHARQRPGMMVQISHLNMYVKNVYVMPTKSPRVYCTSAGLLVRPLGPGESCESWSMIWCARSSFISQCSSQMTVKAFDQSQPLLARMPIASAGTKLKRNRFVIYCDCVDIECSRPNQYSPLGAGCGTEARICNKSHIVSCMHTRGETRRSLHVTGSSNANDDASRLTALTTNVANAV